MKNNNRTKRSKSFLKKLEDSTSKLKKIDWIIMGIFVVFYMIISFYHLGTIQSPKSYHYFTFEGEELNVELPTTAQAVSKIRYYTGPEIGKFRLEVSSDGTTFKEIGTVEEKSVFSWEDFELDSEFKYLKIVTETPGSYLGEIQLYNKYGEKLLISPSDDKSKVVLDEASTVPGQISYLNSAYFDEIYFARSAYEYVNGINAMEWVHPPLGKLIMAIPILLLGMSPFAFRLMGTLAGVLMIPVIYTLAKRIFKNRKWAILAGLLMTFDCFHFAHTRMGTVDSFLVLFMMLSTLFMYQYIDMGKKDDLKKKLKNLFLSGLFLGCAIATKWTGLYLGAGLAVVFFADLIYENVKNKKITNEIMMKVTMGSLLLLCIVPIAVYYITAVATKMETATLLTIIYFVVGFIIFISAMIYYLTKKNKDLWKIIVPCVCFFVIIPLIIYILSYMLFPTIYNYSSNSISGIINQTKDIFTYHSTLGATHEFSSNWYTWPAMTKPVWYYVGYYGGNIRSTIVGIGNPAIWWGGIIASIYVLVASILKRKRELLFILVLIAFTWLPYVFIGRTMFMYHYFPTLPFIMLAIVAFIKYITEKIDSNSVYIFYVAIVILLFIIFYPVISGMLTTNQYIDGLKWLGSWIF